MPQAAAGAAQPAEIGGASPMVKVCNCFRVAHRPRGATRDRSARRGPRCEASAKPRLKIESAATAGRRSAGCAPARSPLAVIRARGCARANAGARSRAVAPSHRRAWHLPSEAHPQRARRKRASRTKGARHYMFEIDSRWTVDGSPRSNVGRYAEPFLPAQCRKRGGEGQGDPARRSSRSSRARRSPYD